MGGIWRKDPGTPPPHWLGVPDRGGASRSQSALHMHVLVCICSNVRQFHEIIGMIQMCYHTNHCACWPCFVNTTVFICYKTEKGTLMILSFTRVTRVQTGGGGGGAAWDLGLQ